MSVFGLRRNLCFSTWQTKFLHTHEYNSCQIIRQIWHLHNLHRCIFVTWENTLGQYPVYNTAICGVENLSCTLLSGKNIITLDPFPPQTGRKKRIKLLVDRENETSSTGEESTTETQWNRVPNCNINGNVYLAQNGTIVRTRRLPHPNNLKVGSPCRLGKHFKKLDKLGVTHEEPPPVISIEGSGNNVENGTDTCSPSNVDVNLNTRSSCSSLASTIKELKGFGSKTSIAKALIDRNSVGPCGSEEQETSVDNHKSSRETVECHSDYTLSDEEELWMGPWNSLHIPMTKLWLAMQKIYLLFVIFLTLSCCFCSENYHKIWLCASTG